MHTHILNYIILFLRTSFSFFFSLGVGDSVRCEVDYDQRREVAPNHTMTHVLNFALRKVLGDDVDQKGSLVTHEKLR